MTSIRLNSTPDFYSFDSYFLVHTERTALAPSRPFDLSFTSLCACKFSSFSTVFHVASGFVFGSVLGLAVLVLLVWVVFGWLLGLGFALAGVGCWVCLRLFVWFGLTPLDYVMIRSAYVL